ncbi:uncharacterized protein [Littorina saxatilis]|uniref:Claudin n=1 Tax=Littorina saxatilis TaxID=31220 RepID=A0AAN9AP14_9CAEN
MMSSRKEKIISAGCALIILVVAMVLILAGSFIPLWATVKNTTVDGNRNVSYSLWTRQECFGIICTTNHVKVQWSHQECWPNAEGKEVCETKRGYKIRVDTTCRVANYCNHTWIGDGDFKNATSLLLVAKAFETPAIFAALLSIVLYGVKIGLLVKHPNSKRLHLKAAYLTFGAIAGFAAVVGMTIFSLMLDKENYNLEWAPYLNCAGGVIYIFFGVGGYLSWRNSASRDEFDDDCSEFEREISDVKTNNRQPFLDRQTSKTSAKALEAHV